MVLLDIKSILAECKIVKNKCLEGEYLQDIQLRAHF